MLTIQRVLYRIMVVVTIGLGSLAVVSLVVVTGVSIVVTIVLTILKRGSRPKMEHCQQCHLPVYIKGAKVPPYCRQSPRNAVDWSRVEGGQIFSDQNSPVFKRSCSTRKKIRNQSDVYKSQEEGGSFFR